jgi:peptidoglycan/LPS O-acetylase OafA/YrhL
VLPRRLGYRAPLDGVRAVAILGVIGLHTIPGVVPGGFYGVDIFFVLSAFLITSLVIEEHDEAGRFDYRSFYWRRAFRLAPALLVWLAVVAPVTAVVLHQGSSILFSSAASLFYFSDFALAHGAKMSDPYKHVWSLSVEEQFYLVWPYILVAGVLAKSVVAQRRTLLIAVEASVVVMAVCGRIFPGDYYLPTGHLISLTVGCLAGTLFMRGGGAKLERAVSARLVGPACIALLAFAFLAYPATVGNEDGVPLLFIVAAIAGLLLLHLCLRPAGAAHTMLSSKPAVWLGRRSYGLYLYSRTLTILVPALAPNVSHSITLPLGVAAALGVAELSFRYIERPVNRAGRAWLRSRRDRTALGRLAGSNPLPSVLGVTAASE